MIRPGDAVTDQLTKSCRESAEADERHAVAVYGELPKLASSNLRCERAEPTLEPTAVFHGAHIRLLPQRHLNWHSRAHMYGIDAGLMRRPRRSRPGPAGVRAWRCRLDHCLEAPGSALGGEVDVPAVDQALNDLAAPDRRQAEIVGLCFLCGPDVDEIGEPLNLLRPTRSSGNSPPRVCGCA